MRCKRKNGPAEISRSRKSTEEGCRGGAFDWYAKRSRSRESTEEGCRGGTLDWYVKRSRSRESTEEGCRGGTLDWLEVISYVSGSRGGWCAIQSESG